MSSRCDFTTCLFFRFFFLFSCFFSVVFFFSSLHFSQISHISSFFTVAFQLLFLHMYTFKKQIYAFFQTFFHSVQFYLFHIYKFYFPFNFGMWCPLTHRPKYTQEQLKYTALPIEKLQPPIFQFFSFILVFHFGFSFIFGGGI